MEGFGTGDGAVFFKVGFVTDHDEGDKGVIFDTDDLVAEFVEFVEGGQRSYAEDEEEALARFHVEFSGERHRLGIRCDCRMGGGKVPHGGYGCVSLSTWGTREWKPH